ncbi:MAG TPA: VTT domain-containing protein [Streptosporangiaceae bacterium]|jgi:membrane-associated protein|nr:VTT domain-containing protein [Streptosporangiaceae bacterium]
MSVPEPEPVQAAEGPAAAAVTAGPRDDPRLPWQGKPRAADIACWLGIVLSGLSYWVLLPLRVSLVGTHPVVAELLNGGTEAIIAAAAFAQAGHGTLAVVVLAAIPGLMKFDALYWWAGRLWGERFIMALPGAQRVARAHRAGRKFTWPAIVLSSFLPIPRAVIFAVAGWAEMRLVTVLILDLIGALLWTGLLAGLGYELGHGAVVAAKTVSRYSLWFTIGLVAVSLVLIVRHQRRLLKQQHDQPASPASTGAEPISD